MKIISKDIATIVVAISLSSIVTVFLTDYRLRKGNYAQTSEKVNTKPVSRFLKRPLPNSKLRWDLKLNQWQVVSNHDENMDQVMVVFSDFNCAFCKNDERLIKKYAQQHGVDFVYFIDTPILGDNSKIRAKMSTRAWLNNLESYDRNRYFQSNLKATNFDDDDVDDVLKKYNDVIVEAKITATPTYIVKGDVIIGKLGN